MQILLIIFKINARIFIKKIFVLTNIIQLIKKLLDKSIKCVGKSCNIGPGWFLNV